MEKPNTQTKHDTQHPDEDTSTTTTPSNLARVYENNNNYNSTDQQPTLNSRQSFSLADTRKFSSDFFTPFGKPRSFSKEIPFSDPYKINSNNNHPNNNININNNNNNNNNNAQNNNSDYPVEKNITNTSVESQNFTIGSSESSPSLRKPHQLDITQYFAQLERGSSLERDIQIGLDEKQGRSETMEDRYKLIPFTHHLNLSQSGENITQTISRTNSTEQEIQLQLQSQPIQQQQQSPKQQHQSQTQAQTSITTTATQIQRQQKQLILKKRYAFFAIYDGHGGSEAAVLVQNKLHLNIAGDPIFDADPEQAIRNGFRKTELELEDLVLNHNKNGLVGTTALVAVIYGSTLYVANAGDSLAILCREGHVIPLNERHTPYNLGEKERVLSEGGLVLESNRLGHPVWNSKLINIAVTRALGDIYFKHKNFVDDQHSGLSAEPEIRKYSLTKLDWFIFMASDGFWDVVSPQEVVDFIVANADESADVTCKMLNGIALKRGTRDNTTVILAKLHPFNEPEIVATPKNQPRKIKKFRAKKPSQNNSSSNNNNNINSNSPSNENEEEEEEDLDTENSSNNNDSNKNTTTNNNSINCLHQDNKNMKQQTVNPELPRMSIEYTGVGDMNLTG